MNFLNDINNKRIPLAELENGLRIINSRFDSFVNEKDQVKKANYLKIKDELSDLFAIESRIRHLDEEKDEILARLSKLKGLDFVFYQELMEEEEERAAEKSAEK